MYNIFLNGPLWRKEENYLSAIHCAYQKYRKSDINTELLVTNNAGQLICELSPRSHNLSWALGSSTGEAKRIAPKLTDEELMYCLSYENRKTALKIFQIEADRRACGYKDKKGEIKP